MVFFIMLINIYSFIFGKGEWKNKLGMLDVFLEYLGI